MDVKSWEVRPSLDQLSNTGGWIQCAKEPPLGYPRNILAYRPDAPIDHRVLSVWFDPFDDKIKKTHPNGIVSDYPVKAWMECPEEPH